jgi:hypothetical protein
LILNSEKANSKGSLFLFPLILFLDVWMTAGQQDRRRGRWKCWGGIRKNCLRFQKILKTFSKKIGISNKKNVYPPNKKYSTPSSRKPVNPARINKKLLVQKKIIFFYNSVTNLELNTYNKCNH